MSQLSNSELECLRSVRRAADELGIPIIAVGANARRLVFDSPTRIPIHRITTDWDFGVRVPNWTVFHQLRTKLIDQSDSFTQGPYEHRLVHKATAINIDLVPFGGLENEGEIKWPGSDLKMNVFGFADAYENAVELELAQGFRLAVATIPLLVALKFFAFADRWQETDRDLLDVWHVMRHYLSGEREAELFDEPLSSIVTEDFD